MLEEHLQVTRVLILFVLLLCTPGAALAAEAESSVVLGTHYHMVELADRAPVHLGGVTAGMEWGLSDFWMLQASLSGEGGGTLGGVAAAGGTVGVQIATLIDATQWIPYLAAGIRGGLLDLGVDTHLDPYMEVYGGADLTTGPAGAGL